MRRDGQVTAAWLGDLQTTGLWEYGKGILQASAAAAWKKESSSFLLSIYTQNTGLRLTDRKTPKEQDQWETERSFQMKSL